MKDIPGFEGLYAITDTGKVWSYRSNKFLKPRYNPAGYTRVHLCGKDYKIHRLVALVYIPNINNLPEVNHLNEKKDDNRVENLEWTTHINNCNYGTRNKRHGDKCKKRVYVPEIKTWFDGLTDAAAILGLKYGSVTTAVRTGGSLKGYHFTYIN